MGGRKGEKEGERGERERVRQLEGVAFPVV